MGKTFAKRIISKQLIYHDESDGYTCPAGHTLKGLNSESSN